MKVNSQKHGTDWIYTVTIRTKQLYRLDRAHAAQWNGRKFEAVCTDIQMGLLCFNVKFRIPTDIAHSMLLNTENVSPALIICCQPIERIS